MRITFVLNCFVRAPSGGFRVVYEYANRLAEMGHQVTVVHEQWREGVRRPFKHVYEAARDKWHSFRIDGLSKWLKWMPINPDVRLTMVRRLQAAHVPDGDIVIATYWTTARLLADLSPRHGTPIHLVQGYEAVGLENTEDVDAVLRMNVPKVAVSNHVAATLVALGVPRSRISVVPNGLDHTVYRPPGEGSERGLSVGVMLSDSVSKDSATAVTALGLTKEILPDLEVVAFGTIKRPSTLPTWAHYVQGLSGTDLADVYRSTSIYLCSSTREGWGFPVAEAMACGAAVVSTLNGGVEDFCVHDRNSLLVPVGSANRMVEAIVHLLTNKQTRARLVQHGLETTREMSWESSTERLCAVLQSLSSSPAQQAS